MRLYSVGVKCLGGSFDPVDEPSEHLETICESLNEALEDIEEGGISEDTEYRLVYRDDPESDWMPL